MLTNFGHGGAMAEIGCGFLIYRHNMTEAKRVFRGGHFTHGGWRWWNGNDEKRELKKEISNSKVEEIVQLLCLRIDE